ncbi:hypothetical protein GCM10007203_23250 [Staphylococcus nepalensis]|nr:hypothetical protein GCM10007203_23250 [Staphylococcus nepalensis]
MHELSKVCTKWCFCARTKLINGQKENENMRYLYNSGNRFGTVSTNNNVHRVVNALIY